MSQSTEAAITSLINTAAVMPLVADLEDHLVKRLISDLVQDIHTYETIGIRYGFGGWAGLLAYLRANPHIVARIKQLKALNDSAMSVNERIQLKAAHGLEDALVQTTIAMTDPAVPIAHRIDYVKIHERLSGAGSQAAVKNGAVVGAQFNLVINFPGGRQEKISTTVAEPATIESIVEEPEGEDAAPPDEDV